MPADTEGTLAGEPRSTARPKAEKQRQTPASTGEATDEALGNSSDDAASISTPTSVPSVSAAKPPRKRGKKTEADETGPLAITRATMALRIEPWRLLPPGEAREAHAKRHRDRPDDKQTCPACQLDKALWDVQRDCAAAYNLAARNLERMDGEFWDAALRAAQGGKIQLPTTLLPDKVKPTVVWPSATWNAYEALRTAFPNTQAGIMSAVAREVSEKWRKERWDVLARMERSAARWKRQTTPIPLRAADCLLVESTESRDLFELHCTLRSGRRATRGKEFTIPIRTKDRRMYSVLREIARVCAGDASAFSKMGAAKIKRDRIGRHWELRIAYTRLVDRVEGPQKIAAINRGIVSILAVVVEGRELEKLYDGYEIEQYLRRLQARRREFQRTLVFSQRKGRGRGHALSPTDFLAGQATRWRETKIQNIAREIANVLQERRVTVVVLDDLQGIRDGEIDKLEGGKFVWDRIQDWPYYQMGMRLKSCLDELGIAWVERPVHYASRDCPSCGHRHTESSVQRTFKCEKCGFTKHVDLVFGINMIQREKSRPKSN